VQRCSIAVRVSAFTGFESVIGAISVEQCAFSGDGLR
jgi:hypothetical protein